MPKDPRASPTKPFSQPFQGLFLDRPAWTIDPRGLADCNNVRVALGRLDTSQSGWKAPLAASLASNPVRGLFDGSKTSVAWVGANLFVGTTTDLIWVQSNGTPVYITPAYSTGTVAVAGTAVTGSGTNWTGTATNTNARSVLRAGDQISFGSATQQSLTATWYTIQTVNSATSLTLTASAGTIGAGTSYTARQCLSTADGAGLAATGLTTWWWDFEVFPTGVSGNNFDVLIATNGNPNDALIEFSIGAGNFALWMPTSGGQTMPFQCRNLRRWKNMMIYGNLYDYSTAAWLPTSIANSDNGNPGAMASGVAGQYVVSDSPYGINKIAPLGNTLMLYMDGVNGGGVIGANYVGGPTGFVFTEVIRGRGAVSGRCVAEFADRHQFLTPEGEYRYNGLFIQPMNTHIWRGLMGLFDYTRVQRAHCTINPALGDLVWALPLTTDAGATIQTAYVEHYMEQANNYLFKPFTKRDWPFAAAASAIYNTSGPETIAGDESGAIWQAFVAGFQGQNSGGFGGVAASSSVTFPQRFVVNERSRGLVKRIYPFVEQMSGGSPALTVTLSMFDRTGGNATITDAQSFDPTSATTRFTTHYRRGRLGQVKVSGTSGWVLDGGDWDVASGGQR